MPILNTLAPNDLPPPRHQASPDSSISSATVSLSRLLLHISIVIIQTSSCQVLHPGFLVIHGLQHTAKAHRHRSSIQGYSRVSAQRHAYNPCRSNQHSVSPLIHTCPPHRTFQHRRNELITFHNALKASPKLLIIRHNGVAEKRTNESISQLTQSRSSPSAFLSHPMTDFPTLASTSRCELVLLHSFVAHIGAVMSGIA